jgi:hypothetical protein
MMQALNITIDYIDSDGEKASLNARNRNQREATNSKK